MLPSFRFRDLGSRPAPPAEHAGLLSAARGQGWRPASGAVASSTPRGLMARAGPGEEEKRGAFELVSTQMGELAVIAFSIV